MPPRPRRTIADQLWEKGMGTGQFKDDRLRDIWMKDPGALGGPPAKPLNLSFPAVEQVLLQAAMLSSPFGRPLTATERTLLESVYGQAVDLSRIRIVETSIAAAPTTLGNQIRATPGFSFDTEEGKATLVHETGHVWQYQTKGTRYITCALVHQAGAAIATGSRNAAYMAYTLDDKRSIHDYPAEEQAMIIEDYYNLGFRYVGPRADLPSWVGQRMPDFDKYKRLVEEVRRSRPKAQTEIYTDSLMQQPRQDILPPPSDPQQRFVPLVPFLRIDF
jgi:hypothetical protein